MPKQGHIISQCKPNDLERLKQAVLEHPEDEQGMHRYYRAAVDAHRIDEARKTFDLLQQQYPADHRVRRLLVAVCLHQKDYPSAMAAIETLVAFTAHDDRLIKSALQVRTKLGPRSVEDAEHGGPTLSLCMIVKNEQAYLGPCLNSAKTLVDEIIVIDTGSTDRSVDLACIYGARVYSFQWCDDFSAARNFGIEKAVGDWVLILDADEIIDLKDQSRIRDLLFQYRYKPVALSFETRNYSYLANGMNWQVNDGSYPKHEAGLGWFPSNKVRLFPRSKKVCFSYPVHELVEPAIKKAGISISACKIPIHHYGNLNEERDRKKATNYFNLGYAKLEQMGNDRVALRELAIQAGQIERWSESIELWQRCLSICPDDGEAHANIAGAYWQIGQYEKGMKAAEKAIRTAPTLKEGHYNLAANFLLKGQPKAAAAILQDLLETHPDYLAARFLLAAVCVINGKANQSKSLMNGLTERLSNDGLSTALQALADKLRSKGLNGYADALEHSALH
jgi:glycosyltransferase involved in cell wall biosynthesis